MKGFTPTLLFFLLACNLNGEIVTLKLNSGDQLGNCIYLNDAPPYIYPDGKKKRKALFQCECGNEFISVIQDVKTGNTTSCGCYHKRIVGNMSRKHGLKKHKLYIVWENIKSRCYNQKDKAYHNYGGRGITICDEWRNDFKAFFDYATTLPRYGEPGLTIDRINNNGNYEKGNLRWASRHIQNTNQRMKSNNSSGFTGISYHKKSRKYISHIGFNGNKILIGYFYAIEDAVKARNQYIIDNKLAEYKIQPIT